MKKRIRGSITVEMTMLFPFIVLIIFSIFLFVFYLNDIVCIRAAAEEYGIISNTNNKKREEIYKEYVNKIRKESLIVKISSVNINKDTSSTTIKTNIEFALPILSFNKKNTINVTMFNKDNKSYIINAKVAIDILKNVRKMEG